MPSTMAYVHMQLHVTIFSTGGKFQQGSNFTELHALTQAAHSYALLLYVIMRSLQ